MRSLVRVCQHVWMLPVEMCNTGGCRKNSSESAELFFTLQSSTAVTMEEDEVIFFYCSTRAYEVMSGPLTCHCCFPCSLLPVFIPHPPNPFGCWGHPERMPCFGTTNDWGRKGDRGEERKGSNTKIKDCFFLLWCCEELSVLLFLGTMKYFWEQGLCWCGPFSGAHQRNMKNICGCMFSKLFGFVCCYLPSANLTGFWRASWEYLLHQFIVN